MDSNSPEFEGPLKPKSKIFLAASLSLLVWPGLGSFIINRRVEGIIQVLLSLLSIILLFAGGLIIVFWATPIVAGGDWGIANSSMGDITGFLQQQYVQDPPTFLGFRAFSVILFSLFLFLLSWIYSLISIILAKQNLKKEV